MTDNVPPTDAGKAREGLIDELETINNYEEMASETSDPKLKAQFEEITDDERVHVGNFAEMISEKDPKAEPKMREGLKEAKEFEKTYRLYSIQEMMCGASHFEKKRGKETSPKERRIQQAMADRVFRNNLRSHWKYRVRNGEIPKDELLHSRAQDMEGIVLESSKLVTPDDMGPEFKRLSTLYGLENPFDYKDQEYITVQGSDNKFYVYAPDDGSLGYKYRQIQMKDVGDGTYVLEFITPKMTEHGSRPIPDPVTPEIALNYYNEAQRRGQVAGPVDKRNDVTKEFESLREERNPGNPYDKWDVNAEIDAYTNRKATGNRIEQFNNNELYQQVEALGFALAKPRIFLNAIQDGSGQEKLERIGKMVIGSEKTSEILSRKGNPDANVNALSKEIAKRLNDAKSIGSHTGLLSNLNTVIDELRNEYPQFDETVKTQMDKMKKLARQDNSGIRVDRNYRLNAKDDIMRGAAREALAQKIAKRKEIERNYRNQRPSGPSVEAAQGIKRYNRDSFVPRLYGKAFPLARIQNYEKIFPDELAFAAIRGSNERADVRRLMASQRRARDEMDAADAIAERTALLNKFPEYDDYLIDAETQREEELERILRESQERKDGTLLYDPNPKMLIDDLKYTPRFEAWWREYFNKDYLDKKWLDSLNETYKKEYGFDPDEVQDSIEKEFHEVPSIMRKKKVGKDEQGNPIYEEMGLETPAKAFAREERKRRLKDWESKERPFMEKKRYLKWVNDQFEGYENPLKQKPVLNPESGFWEYTYEDDGGRARNNYYMSKYGVPFDVASKAQQMKIKEELDAEWPKLVAAQKEKIRQSRPYKRDINERKREWIEKTLRERYGDQLHDYGRWIHENNDWSDVWGDYGTAYATNMDELDDAYIKHLNKLNAIDAYKDENGRWHYSTNVKKKPLKHFHEVENPSDVAEYNENADNAMINATSSRTGMDEKGQADLKQKPAGYESPVDPTSEFGQGKKLESLNGVIGNITEKYKRDKKGSGKVEEQTPAEPMNKSASFEEMLKSANARQWAEKGLPSGCMEATLPAYYRTVTIGSDRDAINVYEHKKMPVGGDGISVKKVPGIGPKMSTKGDE